MSRKKGKVTIAARIDFDCMGQIDALIQQTGQTRSSWLIGIIGSELGRSDMVTVQTMARRIETLEKRFAAMNSF